MRAYTRVLPEPTAVPPVPTRVLAESGRAFSGTTGVLAELERFGLEPNRLVCGTEPCDA